MKASVKKEGDISQRPISKLSLHGLSDNFVVHTIVYFMPVTSNQIFTDLRPFGHSITIIQAAVSFWRAFRALIWCREFGMLL